MENTPPQQQSTSPFALAVSASFAPPPTPQAVKAESPPLDVDGLLQSFDEMGLVLPTYDSTFSTATTLLAVAVATKHARRQARRSCIYALMSRDARRVADPRTRRGAAP